jgi:hypothetical protein
MFYMNDYVGPTRWQWSDESLALIARTRAMLPERFLKNPWYPAFSEKEFLAVEVRRKSPKRIARDDPSEAADSGRILGAVLESFPDARITRTGGIIYHLALSQIYHHFDESDESDRALLASLLLMDELCLSVPTLETHYATAIAIKQ